MVRRTTILLAAAAVALVLAGCGSSSTPSKPTVPRDFFGIDPGLAPDSQDYQGMAKAGVETMRTGLSWASVEPKPGSYVWGPTDLRVGALAAHGIELLPVLSASPAWIADEPTTPPLASPRAQQAWSDFLKAAVARYGPDGSFWRPAPGGGPSPFHAVCQCDADPMPITSWQVWNEPSLVHYFTPTASVSRYAELLRISHDAVTSEDAGAQIVLAGVPGFSPEGGLDAWQYLGKLLQRPGVEGDFDVVSLHPYSRSISQLRLQIRKVRAVMSVNGDSAKPLWITELGWGSDPPDRFGFNKGVQGQKQYLTRAFELLLHERADWHIDRVYWFEWRDPPPSASLGCSFCASAGLLQTNRQPKPAYHAFTRFTHGRAR